MMLFENCSQTTASGTPAGHLWFLVYPVVFHSFAPMTCICSFYKAGTRKTRGEPDRKGLFLHGSYFLVEWEWGGNK